jgi:hypothetical protein
MPNLWREFRTLLPGSPLLLGTIDLQHSDNTVTVRLLGGAVLRVTGSGSVGSRVFIHDKKIIGPAPSLPLIDIDI